MAIKELTKQNIVKALGASSYEEVIRADEKQIQKYKDHVRKTEKFHLKLDPQITPSGNPYLMLSRKVNNKGKKV